MDVLFRNRAVPTAFYSVNREARSRTMHGFFGNKIGKSMHLSLVIMDAGLPKTTKKKVDRVKPLSHYCLFVARPRRAIRPEQ